jgi:tripartite-type tricarboxylate transporter receptor subunit TctC
VAVAIALWCSLAQAQGYPTKPVRIIVPYGAGSTPDVVSRLVAPKLGELWGHQVVVENMVGANGIVGTEALIKSPKDGHTLAMIAANHVVTPALYAKVPFDPIKDITPVTMVGAVQFVLLVNPSLPITNLKEMIAYAKANPGKLTFGSAGNGSPGHLAGQLLKTMAGIDIVHVPYKAITQALTDNIGGQISLTMSPTPAGMAQARGGRLRALAVTGPTRSKAAPEVPTMAEAGVPGYGLTAWMGVAGPAGMSAEIATKLADDFARVLKMPEIADKLTQQGVDLAGSTPAEFATLIEGDVGKWGNLAREAGARLD